MDGSSNTVTLVTPGGTTFLPGGASSSYSVAGGERVDLFSDTASWALRGNSASSAPSRTVLTTAGVTSQTVPAGCTVAFVRLVGGGGGSAGGTSGQATGGGGAAGYAEKIVTGLTPGASIPCTVGAGGTPGASGGNGGNGGTSSFGAFLSATGGNGSVFSASPAGGAPGAGVGGDLIQNGGYGTDGSPSGATTYGGDGGASALGGGGRGAAGGGSVTNGQALGSGAGGTYTSAASAGGTGAAGAIIIEWRPA
jgi:hypothetical protein